MSLSARLWIVARAKAKTASATLTCAPIVIDPWSFHHADILVKEVQTETAFGFVSATVKVRNRRDVNDAQRVTLTSGTPNAQTGMIADLSDVTAAAETRGGRRGLVQIQDEDAVAQLRGEARSVPCVELQLVLVCDASVGTRKYDVEMVVWQHDTPIMVGPNADISAGAT